MAEFRRARLGATLSLMAGLTLAGCATAAQESTPRLSSEELATQIGEAPTPASPPSGQQWLYGSAEGLVASHQTFRLLTAYALDKAAHRPAESVVLAPGATPADPEFIPCGDRPFAAVFDADETLLWNIGSMRVFAERKQDFDPAIWDAWERTGAGYALPLPGAVEALDTLRAAGITIIVNTNRTGGNAAGTEATLKAAGLGEFHHGDSLFLMGDDETGSSKDRRRETISARYCVIALGGDQLGDFAQAFNQRTLPVKERKAMAANPAIASMWGNGWFLFANPVYGPSIRGDFDDVFPAERRWTPEEGNE
ncbi:MAG: HAD family acid phosphatase [Blastomonas sp.]